MCSNCPYFSYLRIKLKLHIRKRHLKLQDVNKDGSEFSPHHVNDEKKNKFRCEYCSFVTARMTLLTIHLDSHARNVPIRKCPCCSFESTYSVLKRHVQKLGHYINHPMVVAKSSVATSDSSTNTYKCKSCPFATFSSQAHGNHIKTHVKKTNIYKCPRCSFGTDYLASFNRHTNSHRLKQPIMQCKDCNFRSTLVPFKKHICNTENTSKTDTERTLKSNNDSKVVDTDGTVITNSKDELQRIESIETPNCDNKTKLFKCKSCPFATFTSQAYGNHIKTHVKKINIYKCPRCAFDTGYIASFNRHMNSHRLNRSIIQCKYCNFRSTLVPFKNHICNSENTSKTDTEREHTLKSNDDSKVVDTDGTVITNSKDELQRIESIETPNGDCKNKLFKCIQCSFSTCLRIKLNVHTKKYHQKLFTKSVKTNHQCKFCSYTSTNLKRIEVHTATHTKWQMPVINCANCEYRSTAPNLKIHAWKCKGKPVGKSTSISLKDGENIQSTSERYISRDTSTIDNMRGVSQTISKTAASVDKDAGGSEMSVSNGDRNKEFFMSSPGLYACAFCSYTTKVKERIAIHTKVHRNNNVPIRQCPNCSYRSTPKVLSNHLFKCSNSSKTPNGSKHNSIGKQFVCDICFFTTSFDWYLKQHVERRHSEQLTTQHMFNEVFKCTSCRFITLYKGKKQIHETKRKHTFVPVSAGQNRRDERDKISNVSSKNAENQSITQEISNKETEAEPMSNQSPIDTSLENRCDKAYNNNSKIHKENDENESESREKKNHSTSIVSPKSFKCQHCSFTSFCMYLVERHMNSHTLNLPIKQCGKCDFRSTPATLLAHTNGCTGKPHGNNLSSKKITCSEKNSATISEINSYSGRMDDKGKGIDNIKSNEVVEKDKQDRSKDKLKTKSYRTTNALIESVSKKGMSVNKQKSDKVRSDKSTCIGDLGPNNPTKAVFNCSLCKFATHLRIKLKFHLRKNHLKPKKAKVLSSKKSGESFECKYCSYICKDKRVLERHGLTHTVRKMSISKCTKCDFRSTAMALREHELECFISVR